MPSQCLSLGSFWFNMSNEARIMHGLKNPIAAALVYVRFPASSNIGIEQLPLFTIIAKNDNDNK